MKKIILKLSHSHYFIVALTLVFDINLIIDNDDVFDWIVPGFFTVLGLTSFSLIIQGRVWDVVLINGEKKEVKKARVLKKVGLREVEILKDQHNVDEVEINGFSVGKALVGTVFVIFTIIISLNDWIKLFEK